MGEGESVQAKSSSGKAGCSGILRRRQVSVASVGALMLFNSLSPTKAGARDAAHSHQMKNKPEKHLAGLELAGAGTARKCLGQSGYKAGEAWMGRWGGKGP